MKALIYIRRTLAILIGAALLLLFVDVTHSLLPEIDLFGSADLDELAEIQLVPLLIEGLGLAVVAWLVLTLLLGRFYCSIICPLGILQDVVGRVKTWWWRARKQRKKLRMRYRRPLNILRYGTLGIVAVSYVLGLTLPLLLLDPYSNFGRIATGLFRPIALGINNTLAAIFNGMGNYTLYAIGNIQTAGVVAISAGVVLVILVVLVWRRGRLWCNTLCPVGTLLGLFSRFSLLRVRLGKSCNQCGNCVAACKAECIDVEAGKVDGSRCVSCFSCLSNCPKGAISYRFAEKSKAESRKPKAAAAASQPRNWCRSLISGFRFSVSGLRSPVFGFRSSASEDPSRRQFLKGSLLTLAALPAAKLLAQDEASFDPAGHRTRHALPPGALSREQFRDACTACQLCVAACPTQVLRPALLENGLVGVMQPFMNFRLESYCSYECRACIDACPNQAIAELTTDQKKLTRIGVAHFLRHECIVHTEHQDCGACAEHCPTGAAHMVPWRDGLTIPVVDADYCIGCGGCESICPVQPKTAIFVQGLDVQQTALPPRADDNEAEEVVDFGF